MKRHLKTVFAAILLTNIVYSAVSAQNTTDIEIKNVYSGEFETVGFIVNTEIPVKITGSSILTNKKGEPEFYGWILNSKTREVVWELSKRNFRNNFDRWNKWDKKIFSFEEEITLEKGEYELYYSGFSNTSFFIKDLKSALSKIFRSDRDRVTRKDRERLGICVSGKTGAIKEVDSKKLIEKRISEAFAAIIRCGDNEYASKGFALKAPARVRVYSIGEGFPERNEVVDYGWIYDVGKHRRVWETNVRRSDHAGGGEKNRVFNDVITLPAGSYKVYYVSDGSHSYDSFNEAPPYDPEFWGITVWPADSRSAKNLVPFEDAKIDHPVIDLTKIRDYEFVSAGMSLEKDMKIRILCLGEKSYFQKNTMGDFGWIINADTRKTVWSMEWERTEHAGGDKKNRMSEVTISLKKGNYIVYYKTDDSHAFRDWNASPPYEQDNWGISVWPAISEDRKFIKQFDADSYKNKNVIVELTRIRNDEYVKKSFDLTEDTRIRIICVGEGQNQDMFDYGWIENNETGRVEWKMRYRDTEHDGGSSKNRIFNDVLDLPKGSYTVFYRTDDTHAYRNWNEDPPLDAEWYGITILREK